MNNTTDERTDGSMIELQYDSRGEHRTNDKSPGLCKTKQPQNRTSKRGNRRTKG